MSTPAWRRKQCFFWDFDRSLAHIYDPKRRILHLTEYLENKEREDVTEEDKKKVEEKVPVNKRVTVRKGKTEPGKWTNSRCRFHRRWEIWSVKPFKTYLLLLRIDRPLYAYLSRDSFLVERLSAALGVMGLCITG